MNYRKLGKTDLTLSEITFGPMRFETEEKNGKNALDQAIDLGVNTIHSSYEYKTIDLLGSCLKEHPKRHELNHIIKVSTPEFDQPKFDKQLFRKRIEDALRTLHTDRIDVVQHLQRGVSQKAVFHKEGNAKRITMFPEVLEEMLDIFDDMKKEGKVGYLASFPMTTEYGAVAINSKKFDALVGYYNAIETDFEQFFPALEEEKMGFIAIRPLLRGLLTDRRANRKDLPADDTFKGADWDDAYDLLSKINSFLQEMDMSLEAFAIKFCLADPRVTTLVMGLNNPTQVDVAVQQADGNYLDDEVVRQVINTINRHKKERKTWSPFNK
ncbi:aldo/keto reductase [Evansella sp. AB-P1]|uniref:aldo/keto reductase n=1 Tax=Evansella sp. AB-P1 TaxID=3037653 RepID=UPI00241E65CC|nr:aldo/keto reductase [Evansella sp. AB-P1]MDG5788943.1 aldo/keto reductase [Evansella sp. AB-P1]